MMKRRTSLNIRPEDNGTALTVFLAGRFTYFSRQEWEQQIAEGRIQVNGKTADRETVLCSGDFLEYRMPEMAEPPVDTAYGIIFEDAALIAINKPGNLPCHPGGRYFNHTLWALLKKDMGIDTPAFVHRIDRETSGIVLIARTPEDARQCRFQFEAGTVRKRYLVRIEGRFPEGITEASGYMIPDMASLVRKKQRFCPLPQGKAVPDGGKSCCTVFRLLETGQETSLVEAIPKTGRLHQIRATLAGTGYPVTGDKIYGVDETLFLRFIEDRLTGNDLKKLRLSRQALHAAELCISHPRTGERLCLTAPLPPDMAEISFESPFTKGECR